MLFRTFLKKNNDLEISILKRLAQEEKLILMFDGVDEVSDYKEQVKTLIKSLSPTTSKKMKYLMKANEMKSDHLH